MYRVMVAMALEEEASRILDMPVWSEDCGFLVISSVHNGRHALELLRHEHFDLTLLDLGLPLLDGLQLLRQIQDEDLCPVVCMLGSTARFQYIRECIFLGAFDYLPKNMTEDVLRDLLARAGEKLSVQTPTRLDTDDLDALEEQEICERVIQHDDRCFALFTDRFQAMDREKVLSQDRLARRFFLSVINRLFGIYPWLSLYLEKSRLGWKGALRVTDEIHTFEAYLQAFQDLVHLIWQLTPRTQDAQITQLTTFVLSHPEEDLRLKTAAEHLFMNYSYLSNAFSLKVGMTYSSYVSEVRMRRACYLLEYDTEPIGRIAERLRYKDAYYFTTLFKQRFQMTPTEYRNQHARNNSAML